MDDKNMDGVSCKNCRFNDPAVKDNPFGKYCKINKGCGEYMRHAPCGLFVREGEESDRNEHGLRPCICGEKNVYIVYHGDYRHVYCPSCGLSRSADDFGVKWNQTMYMLEEMLKKRYGGMD